MTFEKPMFLIIEVKGFEAFEASVLEVTSMKLLGMKNIEKLGKMIFEVVHFEMENIEVTILEVKSKMGIEVRCFKDLGIKEIPEKGLDMHFEVSGLEVKWAKVTITEVMGKKFIGAMGKMTVEVLCIKFVKIEETIFEGKDKMIVAKCYEENGIEVMFHEPMGKATILEGRSIGKQNSDKTISKAMGQAMIFVEKSVEEIGDRKEMVFEVMCLEGLDIEGSAYEGTRTTVCEASRLEHLDIGKKTFNWEAGSRSSKRRALSRSSKQWARR